MVSLLPGRDFDAYFLSKLYLDFVLMRFYVWKYKIALDTKSKNKYTLTGNIHHTFLSIYSLLLLVIASCVNSEMIVCYCRINVIFFVSFDNSCYFASHKTSEKWFPLYTFKIKAAGICDVLQGQKQGLQLY